MPARHYAIPVVDRRGSGLGNELILWGKSFIAGQALGIRALHPAWGVNRRNYWRYFQTTRTDFAQHQALRRLLPSLRFTEDAYHRHGGGDYATAVKAFAEREGFLARACAVLEIEGLWGGPGMLAPAREFIRGRLLSTRWTAGNLFQIDRRTGDDRLRVGVHIRRGDFGAVGADGRYAGKFNLALPFGWYEAVMQTLHAAFGNRVVFMITSDASVEELRPITSRFPCVTTQDIPNSDVSDLLALGTSDFLICSVSSFSLWAAFLGCMPYAWFEPQLSGPPGERSIWGHMAELDHANSPLSQARAAIPPHPGRGIAVGMDGTLPDWLIGQLETILRQKPRSGDLIRYGVVP